MVVVAALVGAIVVGALVLPALRPETVPVPTKIAVIPVSETVPPSATSTEIPAITPSFTNNPTNDYRYFTIIYAFAH